MEEQRNRKLLVVEDEIYLQRQIKAMLTERGYEVETASSRAEAVQYILNDTGISLYLLDIWLPDGDGFDLCRLIRQKNMKPVIFLTACDDEESVVKGLDLGGDDYVSKPFRTAELLSRIQANLRRNENPPSAVMKSGQIRVDTHASTVQKDGSEVSLSSIEYRLLVVLMENPGRIVRRESLMERLWDAWGQEIEDNTLSVNISRLRRKIGSEYIETIRGFGYRFAKPVERCLG